MRSCLIALMVTTAAMTPLIAQELLPGDLLNGQSVSPAAKYISVSAVSSHTRVSPGQSFHVALVMKIADGWYYYSADPGVSGDFKPQAGSIESSAGDWKVAPALWPADQRTLTDLGDRQAYFNVYKKRAVFFVPVTVPKNAAGQKTIEITPDGQICSTTGQCIPLSGFGGQGERGVLTALVTVQVGAEPIGNPQWNETFTKNLAAAMPVEKLRASHVEAPRGLSGMLPAASQMADLDLWAGLGLALLAGLSLNIMPCVLPIIPLRIYSLVKMAHESRRRYVTLGLTFAAGIVLFFVALGAVNVVLKLTASGTLDINEHFKYPAVRIAIAMVLLTLSANLFGLFNVTVPSKVASLGAGAEAKGHLSALGMGFMMAVLSTPCSFWLMAMTLGWAQLQSLWLGTLALVLIGVGMGAPHALLAAFPSLVRHLPKPGRWMELFKQTMGFLLLPAVLWLLSTLYEGSAWPFWVAGFGLVLVFGLWMWGTWVRYDAPLKKKLIVRGLAVAMVISAGAWMLPQPAPPLVKFEPFDLGRIVQARKDGQIVLVKVTAAWCTSCKELDWTVFNTHAAAEAFKKYNVATITADVTNTRNAASRWLAKTFGGAPPMAIIYPADGGEPFVKVGMFSMDDLVKWLDRAGRGR